MAIAKASVTSGVESSSSLKIRADRRGKSKLSYPPKKCSYCKGLFIPFQKHQKFCCEGHQKLYWKYGTLPFEKLARKLESRLFSMIAAELAPLRARLDAIERGADIGFGERAISVFDRLKTLENAKRGGGAGA